MAHIPEETIGRIKRDASLVAEVERGGITLSRHGARDLAGRCPFHSPDDTPSLIITPSTNLYHCFGCGAAGNVIQWVERTRGIGFREAALLLLEALDGPMPRRVCPLSVEMSERELGLSVVEYYHERLLESAEAREYLASRGLDDEETIQIHKVGVSDRRLGRLIPEKNRVAGGELRRRLQGLGLWRESGHEHAAGSIVVPIFDEDGALAQLYARKIRDDLRPGTPKHLYLPGPLRGVWNWQSVAASKEIILCEALLDALTFWRWGYRNVTASFGVEGFTESHWALFREYVERVLIAYDADAAGDRATEALAEKLMAAGIECFRIRFPRGMDANEYALRVTPGDKSLGTLIRGAAWLGKGARPMTVVAVVEDGAEMTAAELPVFAAELPILAAEPLTPTTTATASPVAPVPALDVAVAVEGEAVLVDRGDRRYRVRGLERNLVYGQMKVNLFVTRGEALFADALDLVLAKARREFAREASGELGVEEGVVKHDLGRVLFALEGLQDERIRATLVPKSQEVALSDEEREAALELLRDPRVLGRILSDFARCGLVGEETNKLVGILAAISRKLAKPLGVLIQSSSAAGKTSVMEAILAFVPDEERVKYSAMTGQSLFYMSETDLRHKVLALVEEEGAERASYALKLLQSEGELAIASTGKDPQSGRLITHEYRVEGPVALLLTTTAAELDEELLNRCIVLTVDEDREQTRAIHRQQREHYTLEGLWAREDRAELRRLHQNAQRLLRPLGVVIPWARRMTFLDAKTRTRRDHEKYLTLIAVIALVHQYQREIKSDRRGSRVKHYIEATLDDIEIANRLASEVLGRSLDELAPQTRRLLVLIERMIEEACARLGVEREQYRFTRRQVREYVGWSDTQVRVHLDRLVALEYVLVHRGGRGQQFVHELLYDGGGKEGQPFLVGLIDVERLRAAAAGGMDTTDTSRGVEITSRGEEGDFAGTSRAVRGPIAGTSRGVENDETPRQYGAKAAFGLEGAENAYRGETGRSNAPRGRSNGTGEAEKGALG